MDYDVVIIGAGAAGLIAARELSRAGRSVALLEARDRFGGRLRQADDPRALAPIELGGEFVHGRPAVTYALLHEMGATVIDNAPGSFSVRDGTLQAEENDPFDAAGALLARALESDADESVDDFITRRAHDAQARRAGDAARRLVAGFDAADPARASVRATAAEWAGDASAEGAQSRPAGGYAPLIAHLARALDPARVDVHRDTIVSCVARDGAGVTVTASRRARTGVFRAAHAIVTAPIGVLAAASGELGHITFEPELPPSTREAIGAIAMGPVVKIVLCFQTPFWEALDDGAWRDGAFFSGNREFPTVWTQLPVRANTLVAWAGGPFAERLAAYRNDERTDIALACVGDYFGDRAAAAAAFSRAYAHDWQRDPFARGAYSYVLVGGERARESLCAPVDRRVWFAGEATAARGEGGTVAGALESGLRAARSVLAAR